MTLRLDPAVPLVWRSPTSLQLGVERVIARLDDLSLHEERMLAALDRGASLGAIALVGGGDEAARNLLARVAPALAAAPLSRGSYRVHGSGPLAEEIASLLRSSSSAAGPEDGADPDVAVLVADWVISPADAGTWLRRDIRHLPVVAADGVITVGPLVTPGAGPCLHCVGLARRDEDPSWPAIASQLLHRSAPVMDPVLLAAAAALAARRALDAIGPRSPDRVQSSDPGRSSQPHRSSSSSPSPDAPTARSWTLDTAGAEVLTRTWSVHPECRCSARPGTDWAAAGPLAPN